MTAVVTGTGRSGTMWLARALAAAGCVSVHEQLLTVKHWSGLATSMPPGWNSTQVEVSCGAPSFYDLMPEGTHVAHVHRDPVRTAASWYRIEVLVRSGAYSMSRESERLRRWYVPEVFETEDEATRCVRYVYHWMRLCQRAPEYDLPYREFALEDLRTAQGLTELATWLGLPVHPELINTATAGMHVVNNSDEWPRATRSREESLEAILACDEMHLLHELVDELGYRQ
jgi:hypothetical protein